MCQPVTRLVRQPSNALLPTPASPLNEQLHPVRVVDHRRLLPGLCLETPADLGCLRAESLSASGERPTRRSRQTPRVPDQASDGGEGDVESASSRNQLFSEENRKAFRTLRQWRSETT